MSTPGPEPLSDDAFPPEEVESTDAIAEEAERSAIVVDGCKIKTVLRPSDVGEEPPKSWKALKRAVQLKLMSIAFHFVGLVDDCLHGSRKLVRGVAEIPPADRKKVALSHARAEREEAIQQKKVVAGRTKPPTPSDAAARFEEALREIEANGVPVEIRTLADGRTAIVIVKPEDRPIVDELIDRALPAPPARATTKRARKLRPEAPPDVQV